MLFVCGVEAAFAGDRVGVDTKCSGLCKRAERGRFGEAEGEPLSKDCSARQVPSRLVPPGYPSPGGGVGEKARKCDRVRYLLPSQGMADCINIVKYGGKVCAKGATVRRSCDRRQNRKMRRRPSEGDTGGNHTK